MPTPANPPADPSGGRRIPVRLRCVHDGRTSYPYVADIGSAGVEIFHRQSRQSLPLPWQELIRSGADAAGMTPDDFLVYLAQQVRDTNSPSGPSAPTSETAHASSNQRDAGSSGRA